MDAKTLQAKENGHDGFVLPSRALGWAVVQRADDPDVARANAQLKRDIADGATGVTLVFEGAHNAFGFGLPAKADTVARLFDGVDLDGLYLRLDNHPHGRSITESFINYLQAHHINLAHSKITFGVDPTASLATTGRLKMSIAALNASLPQSMSAFFASGLPGIVLEADGRPYHHAGASLVQELAAMISVAHGFLDMVEAGRHPAIHALPHIGFATALDQDPVLGIAKLRALQLLWRRLQESRGVKKTHALNLHVETSMRMMVKGDTVTNAIRASYSVIAAIAGGATSLSVLAPSAADGLPDASARRAALMSQLVLAFENVAPAERLVARPTREAERLADAAWQSYQHYQAQGGVMQSLLDGTLARQFEEASRAELSSFLTGERKILAVNAALPSHKKATHEHPSGIYPDARKTFVPEGMSHCAPLICKRMEELYAESKSK